MYRNFRDESETLNFKLRTEQFELEQFELDARIKFRRQAGSKRFAIDIVARRQDGLPIENCFDYSEVRLQCLSILFASDSVLFLGRALY